MCVCFLSEKSQFCEFIADKLTLNNEDYRYRFMYFLWVFKAEMLPGSQFWLWGDDVSVSEWQRQRKRNGLHLMACGPVNLCYDLAEIRHKGWDKASEPPNLWRIYFYISTYTYRYMWVSRHGDICTYYSIDIDIHDFVWQGCFYYGRVFHVSVADGFSLELIVIVSLLKSPGLFSVFWPISIV